MSITSGVLVGELGGGISAKIGSLGGGAGDDSIAFVTAFTIAVEGGGAIANGFGAGTIRGDLGLDTTNAVLVGGTDTEGVDTGGVGTGGLGTGGVSTGGLGTMLGGLGGGTTAGVIVLAGGKGGGKGGVSGVIGGPE